MSVRPRSAGCWSSIGVHGDSSCEILVDVQHCRDCSTYRSTATMVLDKPPPIGYVDEATQLAAQPYAAPDTDFLTMLVFRLGAEWFAIRASSCQEVTSHKKPHSIPMRRDGFVRGVVNVRGELLIAIRLDRVLKLPQAVTDEAAGSAGAKAQRLLITEHQGNRYAIPVSEVHGLVRVLPASLERPPLTLERAEPHFTTGIFPIGEKSISSLDEELLFYAIGKGLA